jgi:carbon storage regulator
MLVLSRQRDETIRIGDAIAVTVVDIRGDKVRLGINAPSLVPVHREEIYAQIQREALAAGPPVESAPASPGSCSGPVEVLRASTMERLRKLQGAGPQWLSERAYLRRLLTFLEGELLLDAATVQTLGEPANGKESTHETEQHLIAQ